MGVGSNRASGTVVVDRLRWKLGTDAARMLVLAAVYYVAARLSLRFALVGENITPVWPPTGIALAAFVLFGRRLWPGVFLAAFLVNSPISASLPAALGTAAGNALAPLLAATILDLVDFSTALDRTRDAVALVLVALGATTISATCGAAMLVMTDSLPTTGFRAAWSVWWAGDAMGILVVAPFLLSLTTLSLPQRVNVTRVLETIALFATVTATSVVIVSTTDPLLFLALPLVGWAAWRFQQRGAAPVALLVSGVATWAAVTDRGPFDGHSLLGEMLVLQAFNACVAITSFVFAAIVSERLRARNALERNASELEDRVDRRTGELSNANARLAREIADRLEAEVNLKRSEGQLAEAQAIAHVGSWSWDLANGEVHWSDELFRIHGHAPGSFPVTFDVATELIVPEDRPRITANVRSALAAHARRLPDVEYRIVRSDGETRVLFGRARIAFGPDGEPATMLGTVQDVTERREYEREHRVAETLQLSLLPQRLPIVDGVDLAARYVAAEEGAFAGGDWYDVIPLPDGTVAITIGDVSGHGVAAASVMGQARMAVRAYALAGDEPTAIIAKADRVLGLMHPGEMVTMLYLVIEPQTGRMRFVNAGHPPPLLRPADGDARFLHAETGLPLGLGLSDSYPETEFSLQPGDSLLLYTDGLIDRRDLPIERGMRRLLAATDAAPREHLQSLCDLVLDAILPPGGEDDIAVLSLRLRRPGERFRASFPAEAAELSEIRHALGSWITARGATEEEVQEIVLACSEACANAVEHAYGSDPGTVEVEVMMTGDRLSLVVGDRGRWRDPGLSARGRGFSVMEACMSSVSVLHRSLGTEVRMERTLDGQGVQDDRAPRAASRPGAGT